MCLNILIVNFKSGNIQIMFADEGVIKLIVMLITHIEQQQQQPQKATLIINEI